MSSFDYGSYPDYNFPTFNPNYRNNNRNGYSNGDMECDERALDLMKKIRDTKTYLEARKKHIEGQNQQLMMAEDLENIDFWLTLAQEVRADCVYGVDTLEVAYQEILNMARKYPLEEIIFNSDDEDPNEFLERDDPPAAPADPRFARHQNVSSNSPPSSRHLNSSPLVEARWRNLSLHSPPADARRNLNYSPPADSRGNPNYSPPTGSRGNSNYSPPTDSRGNPNYSLPTDSRRNLNYSPPMDAGRTVNYSPPTDSRRNGNYYSPPRPTESPRISPDDQPRMLIGRGRGRIAMSSEPGGGSLANPNVQMDLPQSHRNHSNNFNGQNSMMRPGPPPHNFGEVPTNMNNNHHQFHNSDNNYHPAEDTFGIPQTFNNRMNNGSPNNISRMNFSHILRPQNFQNFPRPPFQPPNPGPPNFFNFNVNNDIPRPPPPGVIPDLIPRPTSSFPSLPLPQVDLPGPRPNLGITPEMLRERAKQHFQGKNNNNNSGGQGRPKFHQRYYNNNNNNHKNQHKQRNNQAVGNSNESGPTRAEGVSAVEVDQQIVTEPAGESNYADPECASDVEINDNNDPPSREVSESPGKSSESATSTTATEQPSPTKLPTVRSVPNNRKAQASKSNLKEMLERVKTKASKTGKIPRYQPNNSIKEIKKALAIPGFYKLGTKSRNTFEVAPELPPETPDGDDPAGKSAETDAGGSAKKSSTEPGSAKKNSGESESVKKNRSTTESVKKNLVDASSAKKNSKNSTTKSRSVSKNRAGPKSNNTTQQQQRTPMKKKGQTAARKSPSGTKPSILEASSSSSSSSDDSENEIHQPRKNQAAARKQPTRGGAAKKSTKIKFQFAKVPAERGAPRRRRMVVESNSESESGSEAGRTDDDDKRKKKQRSRPPRGKAVASSSDSELPEEEVDDDGDSSSDDDETIYLRRILQQNLNIDLVTVDDLLKDENKKEELLRFIRNSVEDTGRPAQSPRYESEPESEMIDSAAAAEDHDGPTGMMDVLISLAAASPISLPGASPKVPAPAPMDEEDGTADGATGPIRKRKKNPEENRSGPIGDEQEGGPSSAVGNSNDEEFEGNRDESPVRKRGRALISENYTIPSGLFKDQQGSSNNDNTNNNNNKSKKKSKKQKSIQTGCIPINLGLGKIKIEADFVPVSQVKMEPQME